MGLVEEAVAARRVRGLPVEDFARIGEADVARLVENRRTWTEALDRAPVALHDSGDARTLRIETARNATAEQYAAGLVEAEGILLGVLGRALVVSLAPVVTEAQARRVAAFFESHAWAC